MNLWKDRQPWSGVAILAALCVSNGAIAHEVVAPRDRVLTITGRGSRLVPTQKTRVQLGVEIKGKTATEVQSEITRRTRAIVSRLQALQAERFQTTNITLNPYYVQERQGRQIQDGFVGQSNISFVTSNTKAGELLDAAIAAGANQVQQVSFIAPPAELEAARSLALQDATRDALAQADAILNAASLRRTAIHRIQTTGSSNAYGSLSNAIQPGGNYSSTPILGGEQRVEASVTVEVGY